MVRRQAALQQGALMCGQKEVAPHQKSVFHVARMLAMHTPANMGGSRGVVVWHSTGSGKTLTALLIMLAFWKTPHRVIFATTTENLTGNNPGVYAANLLEYFPTEARILFPGADVREIARKGFSFNSGSTAGLRGNGRRVVEIYSFIELANMLGLTGEYQKYNARLRDVAPKDGKYTIFILDEAQNIATPSKSKEQGACRHLRKFFEKRTDIVVFPMTATPGSNVREWLDVLSMVRVRPEPFRPEDASVHAKFAGLVSFADLSSDLSKVGKMVVKEVLEPLDLKYFAAYLRTYPPMRDGAARYDAKNPTAFFRKMREAGSLMTHTAVQKYLTPQDIAYYESRGLYAVLSNKKWLASTKLLRAVSTAMYMPGKQFMYTSSNVSARMIAAMLESRGFQRVTWRQVEYANPIANVFRSARAMRFILFEAREGLTADKNGKSAELGRYKQLMNAPENLNGEFVKIIITTGGYFEGIDIRALRGVHLVEPLFSALADVQAVGRGLRQCGHAALPPPDRNVVIFRYFAVPPTNFEKLIRRFVVPRAKTGFFTERELKALLENYMQLGDRVNRADPDAPSGNRLIFKTTREDQTYRALVAFETALRAYAIDAEAFGGTVHAPLRIKPERYPDQ